MDITEALATDAGLFGLWSPTSFHDVVDYETWEAALLEDEDIVRHIAIGAFVPINIGGDGAYQFVARVGSMSAPAELTERERKYLIVTSEPYLFVATAGAVISGIEHVGDDPDIGLRISLEPGRWQATVALIDWTAEPGQQDDDGAPKMGALPDFVVLINPESGHADYRQTVETFDPPTDDQSLTHSEE
ncbi:hypothetical protein Ais01nite_27770 [Asanoa ishikariensis]|uniref:Uncharacterized protein n=1 Tax=Asanoa ishikariensis TaxID=137265 RepID=A0A1H3QSA7_9ACTN|nr:hypothetical protein [Asanoa ishikariensis]GIF64742.1 hypothetical protein Ais01nite_27770 [Asanoa ishikariensis]SDZ16286.1 hypothetical protein SAMN05421684_3144 [Asanoa ishikariensis]